MTITTPTTRPGRWISIILVVVGAFGVVLAVGGGVARGIAAHSATSQSWSASTDGVEAMRIDTAAAGFEVRFADIAEARLDASTNVGPAQQWRLERDGATLRVETDRRWGWWGFGDWFSGGGEEHVVLTLPAALERAGLDLDVDVAAGSFEADATWGTTQVGISAGSIDLGIPDGDYAVTQDVSAGDATIDVDQDGEATSTIDVQVSAGSISLRGETR